MPEPFLVAATLSTEHARLCRQQNLDRDRTALQFRSHRVPCCPDVPRQLEAWDSLPAYDPAPPESQLCLAIQDVDRHTLQDVAGNTHNPHSLDQEEASTTLARLDEQ